MRFDIDNPPKCAECKYCSICASNKQLGAFSPDNDASLCVAFLWCKPAALSTEEVLMRLRHQISSREAHEDTIGASELALLYDHIVDLKRRADDGQD